MIEIPGKYLGSFWVGTCPVCNKKNFMDPGRSFKPARGLIRKEISGGGPFVEGAGNICEHFQQLKNQGAASGFHFKGKNTQFPFSGSKENPAGTYQDHLPCPYCGGDWFPGTVFPNMREGRYVVYHHWPGEGCNKGLRFYFSEKGSDFVENHENARKEVVSYLCQHEEYIPTEEEICSPWTTKEWKAIASKSQKKEPEKENMRDLCKFYSTCSAPLCPLEKNQALTWLSMDPICHRQDLQQDSLILKQKDIQRLSKTDWVLFDSDVCIIQDLVESAPTVLSPVDCLHTRKRNEGAGYGHIRGENAPKSSKRTLDDYFPMEVVK